MTSSTGGGTTRSSSSSFLDELDYEMDALDNWFGSLMERDQAGGKYSFPVFLFCPFILHFYIAETVHVFLSLSRLCTYTCPCFSYLIFFSSFGFFLLLCAGIVHWRCHCEFCVGMFFCHDGGDGPFCSVHHFLCTSSVGIEKSCLWECWAGATLLFIYFRFPHCFSVYDISLLTLST